MDVPGYLDRLCCSFLLAEHKHTYWAMTHHHTSPLTRTLAVPCLVQEIRETPGLHPSGTESSSFYSTYVYRQSLKAITIYDLLLWQVTSGLSGIHFIPTLKVSIKPLSHTHTHAVPSQMYCNILFMADEFREQRAAQWGGAVFEFDGWALCDGSCFAIRPESREKPSALSLTCFHSLVSLNLS